MKCNYCGSELENGAQFCDNCGMILGFSEDENAATEKAEVSQEGFSVPEYVPNVFQPIDEAEEINEPARELEADTREETVNVTENIPEYVSDIPEYKPLETKFDIEEILLGKTEAKADVQQTEESAEEETAEAEEIREDEEIQETEAESVEEELVQEGAEEAEQPVMEDIYSQVDSADESGQIEEPVPVQQPEADVIRVPEDEITYPEYDDYNSRNKEESVEPDEEFEDITEFVKREIKDKKKNTAAGLVTKKVNPLIAAVLMIVIVAAGVLVAFSDRILPAIQPTTDSVTSSEEDTTEASSEEDTTEAESEEDTTEPESEEDTTEAESEEDTTEAESEEDTTEASSKEDTTESTTQQTTTQITTAPTTTQPTTQAPTTAAPTTQPVTQAPTTTAPTTTQPTTQAPTTTNPYGINDVEVVVPDVYYSQAKTLYCTEEGVVFRSGPSVKYDRVLYLSKGADLTVLGEKDGFCYARSNRYGVYGWVSKAYLSESRPETEGTTVHSGTVTPDKYYETAQIKYTIDGLNLRKGPGTDYGVVSLIIKGYPVKVIGYSSKVSGWVYVTDMTYGVSGWVSAAYLK